MTAIEEQMGGLDEGTIEMLGMFIDMTAPLIEQIKNETDLKNLSELAHSLKGAARSACANVLGDYASDLQDESEAQNTRSDLIENIEKEFKRVGEEIKNLKA